MEEQTRLRMILGGFAAVAALSAVISLTGKMDRTDETVIYTDRSVTAAETDTTFAAQMTVLKTSKTTQSKTTTTAAAKTAAVSVTEKVTEADEPLMLNLNTASVEELTKLKGVGSQLAQEIIAYREEYGDFPNIEAVMNVNGIGEGIFSDICGNIYVDDPVYPEPEPQTEEETEPAEEETAGEEPTESTDEELTLPLDLNSADKHQLMLLPDMTEEAAEGILELRETIGGYSNVYELLYVKELTQKQVEKLVDFVTVCNKS